MKFEPLVQEPHRAVRPIIVFYSIIGFWLFYTLVITARAAVVGFPAQGEIAQWRMFVTAVGIAITWLLYLLMRRFDRQPLWIRIAVAVGESPPNGLRPVAA